MQLQASMCIFYRNLCVALSLQFIEKGEKSENYQKSP